MAAFNPGYLAGARLTNRETEEAMIEETLRLADHNKSLAAKQLGLTCFSLDRRLKELADG
jgi:two-component system, NtrC family, response regulator AtoC